MSGQYYLLLLRRQFDQDIALAPAAFGHIHGLIRVPNQMQITLAVLGVYGDTQAWSTDQGFPFQEVGLAQRRELRKRSRNSARFGSSVRWSYWARNSRRDCVRLRSIAAANWLATNCSSSLSCSL